MKTRMLFSLGTVMVLAQADPLGQTTVTSFRAIPGDAQVTLAWQPAPNVTGYNVKQAAFPGGPLTPIATNVVGTTLTVTNLRNNTAYFFAISSVAGEFESEDTPRLRATPSAPVLDVLPAGAKVEKLAGGFLFTEGPVWNPADGGYLIFSDIDGNRLYRWTLGSGITTFRQRSNRANGNTLDLQGRLLTCEQTTRSVTRMEPDGAITPLVSEYMGKKLNEPNDVVVKSDGTVWFTDPTYGNPQTQPGQYVYRFNPNEGNASITLVAKNTTNPNGICFSPDEKRLYVADLRAAVIRVYDVLLDNSLTNSRVFATVSGPDGIRADRSGRIYSSSDGVEIFGLDGKLVGRLRVPERPANLCFGGTNQEMLFITARSGLYGITRMPDLIVTNITRVPAEPVAGQPVLFRAIVKNQGTGSTPAGTSIRVAFSVGSETNIVWSDTFTDALAPDASLVLTVNAGVAGSHWHAGEGSHAIYATVDDWNRVRESVEHNNTLKTTLTISAAPPDTDGDGLPDVEEAIAGTDPQSAASALRILSLEPIGPGRIKLTWSSVPGKRYRVAALTGLGKTGWGGFAEAVTATETNSSWSGSVGVLGSFAFFRVLVVP